MSTEAESRAAVTTGWDEDAARDWISRDARTAELTTPWSLTAEIAGADRPAIARVLDVASGPGGFLQTVLERFESARGTWYDFSETMRSTAAQNLAHLGDRVEYRVGDMVSLQGAGDPESFDLVTTSRATHHLTVHDLGLFYSHAADYLAPGGWVANLDSLNPGEPWSSRLRAARNAMRGPRPEGQGSANHPHLVPAPRMEDHVACIRAAGFEPALVVWRNLSSGLVMAKKPAA